jgi:hypothetical protein
MKNEECPYCPDRCRHGPAADGTKFVCSRYVGSNGDMQHSPALGSICRGKADIAGVAAASASGQYWKYRTRRSGVGRTSKTILAFDPTDEERNA